LVIVMGLASILWWLRILLRRPRAMDRHGFDIKK
jgi:hypothetical protein